MKKAILLCGMLQAFQVVGQGDHLNIEISREDFTEVEITGSNYVLSTEAQRLDGHNEFYEFVDGRGGKKDSQGVRERNKQYLVNSAGDTLAHVLTKPEKIIIGNTSLSIESNENGWAYYDENNDQFASVKLFWNTKNWVYDISFEKSGEVTETLKKTILLSMVEKAQEASKVDCDEDSDMDTIWFILYASSLGK